MNEEYLFVHNDFHTGNVFVNSYNLEPILLDFGLTFIQIPLQEFCLEYPENLLCKVFPIQSDKIILSSFSINSKNMIYFSPTRDFELLLKTTQDFITDNWPYKIIYWDLYNDLFADSLSKKEKSQRRALFNSVKDYEEFRYNANIQDIKDFHFYTRKYKDVISKLDLLLQSAPSYEERINSVNLSQIENWERMNTFCSDLLDLIAATPDVIYVPESNDYYDYDDFMRLDGENYEKLKKEGKIKRVGIENLLADMKDLKI